MEEKRFAADAAQFGQAMNSIAHGQAMVAAIRDYQKELEGQQSMNQQATQAAVDVNELLDDSELQKLHEERVTKLKAEHEKRAAMQRQGHGEVQEITEGDFLEIVTQTDKVVCHFFHRDFERCKIMDKHLAICARKFFSTRFIKLSAPDAPFFTVKLGVKMLPCVVFFKNGVATSRIVGFDGLGATDDFETAALEDRLLTEEVVEEPVFSAARADDQLDRTKGHIRKGFHQVKKSESDEDSDFD